MSLAVVNMDLGNIRSVLEALRRVGARAFAAECAADLDRADGIVLPGVGAFGKGMESLGKKGLVDPLVEQVSRKKKPVLGICLGMQLLAGQGREHGWHRGLGLVPGEVLRLEVRNKETRVPNIGWQDVHVRRDGERISAHVSNGASFYFAHSYHLQCLDLSDVAATIEFGGTPVAAVIERANMWGVQFHPEKSQDPGLDYLLSFWEFVQETRRRPGGMA